MDKEHCEQVNPVESTALTRGVFLSGVGGARFASLFTSTDGLGETHPRWGKGRNDSPVQRWDVITIGNLSRNRYWGESDARGVRAAICTCTLITGEGFRLLVDPSLADAADMAWELDRRTGIIEF